MTLGIVGALISILLGGLVSTRVLRDLILKLLGRQPPPKTYRERLSELTASLSKASGEVDAVLREMESVATERANSVGKMEMALTGLERRERELQARIDLLQKVPIPVAEQFARLVEPNEKRNARRDWLIFFAGVTVTTAITLVLQLVFKR